MTGSSKALRTEDVEALRRRVTELERAAAVASALVDSLRQSRDQFQSLIANVPGAVYRSEAVAPWRDVFVSDHVQELCGYSAEELTRPGGTAFGELILVEDRPLVEASIREAAERGETFEIQYRIRHADGSTRWIYDRGRVVPGTEGQPRLLEGVVLDITDRMRVEVALRESDERFRALVANVPGVVYRCESRPPYRDLFISEGVLQITGHSAAATLASDALAFGSITLPEERARVDATVASAIERHGVFEVEYRLRHADGSIRWVHEQGRATYAPDGTPLWIDGVVVDVTDRKRSEEALRASEERFRTLVESVPGLVYRCDVEFPYRDHYLSEGARAITGFGPQEYLREGGLAMGELMLPEDRPRVQEAAARAVLERRPFAVQYRIRHADGGIRWAQEQGRATYDPDGRPLWLDGVMIDITEQREAEEARRGLEVQLRQAQKMEAIGTLAGGIAHDFNNILAAVIMHAELLGQDPHLAEREHVAGILAASQRARNLIQQILAFSRLHEPERQPVALDSVVGEALKLLRATLPATIEIRTEIAAAGLLVLADVTEMHQVVVNLCANAAHAMRERGGLLHVGFRPVLVDQTLIRQHPELRPGPWVRLEVRDTGHGMDPGTLERIFDPFFTTKKPGEGTGLGLAVVHGIVRNHGGLITVTSTPGQGSTFHLYFPAVTGQPAPASVPDPLPRQGRGEHLLIVDDEPVLARLAVRILDRLGYRVTAHSDPVEALTDFLSRPDEFALVISDLTMPHMTGIELARRIRQRRPTLPVLLTSGYSDAIDPRTIEETGIRELVGKPFVIQTIAEAVARHLPTA
jgi:PAS domain S-box-containing protein